MSTQYPNNFDQFSVHSDNTGEAIAAAILNNLQDAVTAIQNRLGIAGLTTLPAMIPGAGNMVVVNGQWYISNGSSWNAMTPAAQSTDVKDMLLTTTNATNLLSFSPLADGNYKVNLYFRVVTAATNLSVTVTYDDVGGAQTNNMLPSGSQNVGSHSLGYTLFINATSAAPITVSATAGTANQVYISASITGV